ncbi:MAG: SpoIIE family protein phosphatase [Candidatus Kapabacteria bacterium]|nr:SpoIIE family protein phosphatase [Candidatus Kapabacteria bacterium]
MTKDLIEKYILTVPKNVPEEHNRIHIFNSFIYFLGTLIHLTLAVVFTFINVPFMAIYNVMSIGLFVLCFKLNRGGKYYELAFVIMGLEILLHAVFAVLNVGWNAGFQYFIFLITPILLLASFWKGKQKISASLFPIITYLGLYLYSHFNLPWNILPDQTLTIVYTVASFTTLATFSYLGYYFSLAVTKAEDDQMKSKVEILEKNKQILSSINYAHTLQSTILPDENKLKEIFENSFLIFQPKDIVSGDFYWFNDEIKNKIIIAVADCTGHGVPGAMLSMVGNMVLNEIVIQKGITEPGQILDYLNIRVREILKQESNDSFVNDGMDIGIALIELNNKKIKYSGAKRPMLISSNNGIIVIEPDKKSIGGKQKDKSNFTTSSFEFNSGDCIYLFSDGIIDQNNNTGKKLGSKALKDKISEIYKYDIINQKNELTNFFLEHKGIEEQRDDVTLIGVKLL